MTEEQEKILRSLHFWRRNQLAAKRNNDELEIQKSDKSIREIFDWADENNIPFKLQNQVLHHAETTDKPFSNIQFKQEKEGFIMEDMTKQLQTEVLQHGEELNVIIDNHVTGDKNENSFLTKKEVEHMLNNHFIRVENLLKSYDNQPERSDPYEEIRKEMKALGEDFSKNITDSIAAVKEKVNNGVVKIKDIKDGVQAEKCGKYTLRIFSKLKRII